jgi:hypothetical protein
MAKPADVAAFLRDKLAAAAAERDSLQVRRTT